MLKNLNAFVRINLETYRGSDEALLLEQLGK